MDTAADPPPAKEEAVKEEGKANGDDDDEVELSDEDRQLKEELEGLVEQVKGEDTSVHKAHSCRCGLLSVLQQVQ